MLQYYPQTLARTFDFKGRSRRTEFWVFSLVNFAIGFILGVIQGVTGSEAVDIITSIFQLLVLLPGISVFVRRLHDTGRSGWWWFFPVVSVIIASCCIAGVTMAGATMDKNMALMLSVTSLIGFLIAFVYPLYIGFLRSAPDNQWGQPADGSAADIADVNQ